MPWPVKVDLTGGEYRLDQQFTVAIRGDAADRLYHGTSRMLRRLSARTGITFTQDYLVRDSTVRNPVMVIQVDRPGKLVLGEDESYKLQVTASRILLSAKDGIGALRGIETFLQLLEADSSGYYFPAVNIVDHPRFAWRGLMIDASRHFMPVDVIKRNLDAMAAVKLNVLHWHLSDNQGFRVECKKFPKLTEFGSDELFYTQAQIKNVIAYAADRGIRVVPEFDLPAHTTAWFVGYPQYASAAGPYKIERKWGVFDPVFDPTVSKTYTFLNEFFKEMCSIFPDKYIHIGGDENDGKQWNANPRIRKFMKAHKIATNALLQTYFENKLIPIIQRYHKEVVGWDEILAPGLQKTAVIQSWRGIKSLQEAASKGYRVILSNGYYVDHYMPASSCYLVDPSPDSLKLTEAQRQMIIGGEACMWSEFVSPENVDSRIWPRTAAIAERLGSPESVRGVRDMYRRLDGISVELENIGSAYIKNQQMMIRRLADGNHIAALTNLINVIQPVETYERARTRQYASYTPLTRVVDAAVPDPKVARNFCFMVDDFLSDMDPNKDTLEAIRQELSIWKKNDESLEVVAEKSPILKEIEPISKSLSVIASIGLEALDHIENGANVGADWVNSSLAKIDLAAEPAGEVHLTIISPIKKLVERAGGR